MENNKKGQKAVKVILLGDSSVGKTCIINRYLTNEFFSESTSTLGSFSNKKEIIKNDTKYTINIWDTTGQEKYRSITNLFINGSNIVILVYAIDSKSSFENLDFWYNSVKEKLENENYLLSIVGNKADLTENEEVSEEEGRKFAEENNAKFYFVSAKEDPDGINNLFDSLINEFIDNSDKYKDSESIKISEESKNKKKSTCFCNSS